MTKGAMCFIRVMNENSWSVSLAPAVTCAVTLNCSHPDAESLYREIEKTFYLNPIRPVYSLKTPTNVTIYFTLYSILGVVSDIYKLLFVLLLFIEYLSWDPVQCGTAVVTLPREKLWMPDIVINECMDRDTSPRIPYVHLDSSGYVTDSRPVRSVSSCNLDIYTFPFDVQNCSLTFNSYIHTCERTTAHICNSIVMRRRPTTYVVNLLIPSCFLLIVDLISFLLPPEAVDRATFKMTIILGYTVFLLIMNNLLPSTGNTLPLLNVVFSVCLALMVASLLETIIITKILCKSNHSAVPHWVQILVFKYLAWLVLFPSFPHVSAVKNPVSMSVSDPTSNKSRLQLDDPVVEVLKKLGQDLLAIRIEVEKHLACRNAADEWDRVGHIIDRFLFILYVLFIFFSLIAFIMFWLQWLGQ
uniref:5-hydroxytryptamine receptor 3A-like n=1 Tax=Paramormyrops kingsleyae TaxID=1676925 RepID=A0A3B3QS47_9TELE